MPAMSPATMLRKMRAISLALPEAERKRTRLKAPAVATPAPTLPFTIMMVTQESTGSAPRVVRKLWENRDLREAVKAMSPPMSRATARQSKNWSTGITVVEAESKIPEKSLSSIQSAS